MGLTLSGAGGGITPVYSRPGPPHNPFTPEKLATLAAALRLETGTRVLDLGSASGEMLCTWARDYGVIGTGTDMTQLFTEQAKLRAQELGVADQVKFIHGDATGYVSNDKAGVAACLGATSSLTTDYWLLTTDHCLPILRPPVPSCRSSH